MPQNLSDKHYFQHTLAQSFTCIGVGLHCGMRTIMTVMPAEEHSGYRFVRRDITHTHNEVLASWHTVSDTHLSTTVSNAMGVRVSTIEHLLAALHGCGIDNARIVLDGPEVPIMDGSAGPFVELIEGAGLKTQSAERRAIVIKEIIKVNEGNKQAILVPDTESCIHMKIDFPSKAIGKQNYSMRLNKSAFINDVANSRTFGFSEQISTLRSLGYAKGGSLKNAILIDNEKVLNNEALRYQDEFVRHKVLDSIGDLALSGAHLIGSYHGIYAGHKINNELLHELMRNAHAFEFTNLKRAEKMKVMKTSLGQHHP